MLTASARGLTVALDDRFVTQMMAAAQSGKGYQAILQAAESLFAQEADLLKAAPQSREELFPDGAAMERPEFWQSVSESLRYLREHLEESVNLVAQYLPEGESHQFQTTIHLIPGFHANYGPVEGHQLYALRPGAIPEEVYLFLVHVYYHELSNLYDTPLSKRAASSPTTPDLLRHFLLTLIRNEGIANHVVLAPVIALRDAHPDYEFRYFKYAFAIGDLERHRQTVQVLHQIITLLRPENFRKLVGRINQLLKDPRLPIINLVGIHLSAAIARHHGERALIDCATKEPQEFFRLFLQTDDELAVWLKAQAGAEFFTEVPVIPA